MAAIKQVLVPVMHIADMHSLPERSLSATLKNLELLFLIVDLKDPKLLNAYLYFKTYHPVIRH